MYVCMYVCIYVPTKPTKRQTQINLGLGQKLKVTMLPETKVGKN